MTLLEDFINAAKEIAVDLEFDPKRIKIRHVQTPKIGLDYTAELYDGKLCLWFQAFTAIANIASHRNFPTKKEIEDYTLRRRILLTIYLGRQLLEELDDIINPPAFHPFRKFRLRNSKKL